MENLSEKLFAELCGQKYLQGFVFHSPKFNDPTEKEAGDVVLWARQFLIVFEVVWREGNPGDTKSFIKRIGEKREQLINDYKIYSNPNLKVTMTNEGGETVIFNHDYFHPSAFSGIVLIDSDFKLGKLHFNTVKKSIEQKFPIAIMTKVDFTDIFSEVDTIPDLLLYIRDRHEFMNKVYHKNAGIFLDLNLHTERNLIGFYKIYENTFPVDKWNPTEDYWKKYAKEKKKQIEKRDEENEFSILIDRLTDIIRKGNSETCPTIEHAWEFVVLTRRARAVGLSEKIIDAIYRMCHGNYQRHFAFKNPITGCWLLFYFQCEGKLDFFVNHSKKLLRLKLIHEIVTKNFPFSVFLYAFRLRDRQKGFGPDNVDIALAVEDAYNIWEISKKEFEETKKYFGAHKGISIKEFPD